VIVAVIVAATVDVAVVAVVSTPFQLESIDPKELHVVVAFIVTSHSVLRT